MKQTKKKVVYTVNGITYEYIGKGLSKFGYLYYIVIPSLILLLINYKH